MIRRILLRVLLGILLAFVTLYLGDWGVWRGRGGVLGKVSVSRFQVAPLKGNKEEYYFDGTQDVECSRSIFPQAPGGACWWLAKHPVVFYR